eukprot:11225776-Lingulodinium_polyedra.AAC.1
MLRLAPWARPCRQQGKSLPQHDCRNSLPFEKERPNKPAVRVATPVDMKLRRRRFPREAVQTGPRCQQ